MKRARQEKRLTYRELSKITGIKPSRLCDIEQGRAELTTAEVDSIVQALGSNIQFTESSEAKKRKAEFDKHMIAIMKVYDEIKKRDLGKGKGGSGNMPCPKCGGNLFFTVASLNGHVWGKCSKSGCLSWMQ